VRFKTTLLFLWQKGSGAQNCLAVAEHFAVAVAPGNLRATINHNPTQKSPFFFLQKPGGRKR